MVEFFLVREVTHVISDRELNCGNGVTYSSKTPNASVELNYESPKPSTSTPRTGQSRLVSEFSSAFSEKCYISGIYFRKLVLMPCLKKFVQKRSQQLRIH